MKKFYKIGVPIAVISGVGAGFFIPCKDAETLFTLFFLGIFLVSSGLKGV